MANTSATGGYLEQTTGPLNDNGLRDFLQAVIVGVTGLAGQLVRPNWQPNPPTMPDADVSWCGFGITNRRADDSAFHSQPANDDAEDGAQLIRHEEIDVACSFYGPNCLDIAGQLRDGLELAQNREQLFLAGMGVVEFGDTAHIPELVNNRFYERADILWTIRREVKRNYRVLSFVSASGENIIANAGDKVITINWQTD